MNVLPPALKQMIQALCEFDEAAYMAAFADPFVCSDPVGGVSSDREALRPHISVSRANWQSFEVEMTDVIVDGNFCAIEYTCCLQGRANGFEGLEVRLDCNAIVELSSDGRIALWHEQYDTGVFRRALAKG